MSKYCKFFLRWNVICLAFTLRSLTSTLFPHSTIDVLAHAEQVTLPVWDVLVRDTRRHVKHDDRTLALNVVPITKASKLLLAGRVPAVEADRAKVRVERQRMHFHTQRRHVLLLELSRQVALHERRLANSAITYEDELKFRHVLSLQ